MEQENRGRLLIACPDRQGIVAAVANFLCTFEANIAVSDQYTTEPSGGTFFMRIEFDVPRLPEVETKLCHQFADVATQYDMAWQYAPARVQKRMAIFVSRELHCLQELLWEWQSGQLDAIITQVISNHEDARPMVERASLPFTCIPVDANTKQEVEQKQLALLESRTDVIVLARYMQVLTPSFLQHYPNRIINIHHSFLPAFIGRNPYRRAYDRGVKLIGATAHYVTEALDEGPIIEQDVTRVHHGYHADALKIAGRQVERSVLARAVKWHLEDRVIVHANKTIVFA